MAKFEITDPEAEDYFEAIVEVGFERPLTPMENTRLLQLILETATSRVAFNIFEGFAALELDGTSLKIRFRFSRHSDLRPQPRTNFEKSGKDLSMLMAQFIFYLFAKIDTEYPLSDVPFPPDFQGWLQLVEDLDVTEWEDFPP